MSHCLDYLVRKARRLEQGFYMACQKERVCWAAAEDPSDAVVTYVYYKSILPEPGASVHVGLSPLTDTLFAVPLGLGRCLKCGNAVCSLAAFNVKPWAKHLEMPGIVDVDSRQMSCLLYTDAASSLQTSDVFQVLSASWKDLCAFLKDAGGDMKPWACESSSCATAEAERVVPCGCCWLGVRWRCSGKAGVSGAFSLGQTLKFSFMLWISLPSVQSSS